MRNILLTRRQFCGRLGIAACGLAAAARASSAEPAAFRLRYVVGSSMYGKAPLDQILPEVAKCGAAGIDIWPAPHADQREQLDAMGPDAFRRMLERSNVRLAMITRFDLGPRKLDDEIRLVKRLGGSMIVTGSGRSPGDTEKDRVRAFVESIRPTVKVAEDEGVTLAIENHDASVIDSPDSLRYFADAIESRHVGIAFAPYHLPQDETLLGQLIRDLGPKLVHFYAWQHGKGSRTAQPKADELLQMPGRGPLDFGPLLAALRAINYAGLTEIFMHPFPRGIAIADSPAGVSGEINRSRAYLEGRLGGENP